MVSGTAPDSTRRPDAGNVLGPLPHSPFQTPETARRIATASRDKTTGAEMSGSAEMSLPDFVQGDNWATPREQARERGEREREDLIDRLDDEGAPDLANKLRGCGEPLPLICAHCGNPHPVEVACSRRWCPACAYQVHRERVKRFDQSARAMPWPLFITLTMRNTGDPTCIRTIREHWGRMRRRKLIDQKIDGGIATIEVTNRGEGWHPHLHVLCNCRWLALHVPEPRQRDSEAVKRQKYDHARLELSALWAQVIGQENAVVSALRAKAGDALAYVLKYAVKGSDLINSPDPIAPMIRCLEKSRMISAFGTMHNLEAELIEAEKPKCKCKNCGATDSLMPDWIVDRMMRDAYDRKLGNR